MGSEMCIRDRITTEHRERYTAVVCMRCSFSADINLSNFSHGNDQRRRRNGVVGCDHQFAYTLMDSASSTEPHIVQVLLIMSHCRQIEHSILRYLHCTLPASRSYPASRNTRTHTHTCTLHASSTDSADRQGTKLRFTRFTASIRSKASKICWDPTASKLEFLACFVSTA